MVSNTNIYFGLPAEVRNRNQAFVRPPTAYGEDAFRWRIVVAWDGAYSGDAFEDYSVSSLFYPPYS
jgi:hypothetical protein